MLDEALFQAFLTELRLTTSETEFSTDPELIGPRCVDYWNLHRGVAGVLLKPGSTQSVSELVALCSKHGVAIIPQGGNTGVVGGAIPGESGFDALLSLERMNRILNVDVRNFTATVEAGCILSNLHDAAANANLLFPLSFGAEGSCQIGGVLATNAGGSNVVKYGNARDLVLGLEVVLADGSVWNGLKRLRKDNTGYDLKALFLGSEGTLGVITAAVVKLYPQPRSTQTIFAALPDAVAATTLLAHLRDRTGDAVSAFELISRRCIGLVKSKVPGIRVPIGESAPWYALIEFTSATSQENLTSLVESALEDAISTETIADVAIASSVSQRQGMWKIRESIAEAQIINGEVIYFDIAVPVSDVPHFLDRVEQKLRTYRRDTDINAFGHIGDGNIHFNILQPAELRPELFLSLKPAYKALIYETCAEFDGSISAEHGVGRSKVDDIATTKSATEMALMRAIRRAIAGNAFNPDKLVALSSRGN